MPRRKRYDKIQSYDLQKVERQAALLRIAIEEAERSMIVFCPHTEALFGLREAMRRTINIVNDRDPDYRPPHGHALGLPRQVE